MVLVAGVVAVLGSRQLAREELLRVEGPVGSGGGRGAWSRELAAVDPSGAAEAQRLWSHTGSVSLARRYLVGAGAGACCEAQGLCDVCSQRQLGAGLGSQHHRDRVNGRAGRSGAQRPKRNICGTAGSNA
jgi:hypothetical protein